MSIFNDSRRYADDESYDQWKQEVKWETREPDDYDITYNERCENCKHCEEDDDGRLICQILNEEMISTDKCDAWEEKE